MKQHLSESEIVKNVAAAASWRLARKVIKMLQSIKWTLSGDDSELKTTWDEICVQVQYEKSFYWDAYDSTVRQHVAAYLDDLSKNEHEAIWLQTSAGFEWLLDEPEERESTPIVDDEIVDYVIHEYIYREADRWSNARIRKFIERSVQRD